MVLDFALTLTDKNILRQSPFTALNLIPLVDILRGVELVRAFALREGA